MRDLSRLARKNFVLAAAVMACGLAGVPAARGQTAYQFATLDFPGPGATYIYGISGSTVVGSYNDGPSVTNGFIYNGSAFTTLNGPSGTRTVALSVSGTNVVGYYTNGQGVNHGFLYNGSTLATFDDPLGVSQNAATGISGSTIVGSFTNA